ncbi:MAG TPA: hypothetical protein PLH57_07195 [Oligoflexia bacterium]|nr:hypothetical protein [Oligoflexia bacterium]
MKRNSVFLLIATLAVAVVSAACGRDPRSTQMREVVNSCKENNLSKFKGQFSGAAHKQYANPNGFNQICGMINGALDGSVSAMDGGADVLPPSARLTIQETAVAAGKSKSKTRYTIKEIPGLALVQTCEQSCAPGAGDGGTKCDPVLCDITEVDFNDTTVSYSN